MVLPFDARGRFAWRVSELALVALLVGSSVALAETTADALQFKAEDVRNAADLRGGGVAPGEVVVLLIPNAGPVEMVPWRLAANLAVPDSLGDTRVYFDKILVPIIYTVRGRIGTVVPLAAAGRKTTEVFVEYGGKRSVPVKLNVVSSAPAVFTLDATGKGQAAMLNETGCCNSVRNPAVPGTIVSLYATGEGKLSRGRVAPEVSVTVGGVPAPIFFTQNFGALQVNFRVPLRAPVGDAVPLVLTVRGRRSSDEVTMALRSTKQRVVLVGDDPAVLDTLGRILKGGGYQFGAVDENGPTPDLLIVDLAAPHEEAGRMRAVHPQLRIMALGADLNPATLREASMMGAQAVLTKPLHPSKVLFQVRSLLQKKPAVY